MKPALLTLIILFAGADFLAAQTNTFPSAGNVGIGTTSPSAKLHVNGGDATLVVTDTNSGGGTIRIGSSDGSKGQWTYIDSLSTSYFDYAQTLKIRSLTGGTNDRLTLLSSGNVGIGTTGPQAKLQVSDLSAGWSNQELLSLQVAYAPNSSQKALTWRDSGAITGQIDTRYDGTTVDMVFGHLYSSGYQTADILTIKGSGKVGIGTTTPQTKLQLTGDNVELGLGRATVDGTAYTRFGMTTSYDTYWSTNATYSGGAWNYINPYGWGGFASRIDQGSGNITFDTVSGGTNPIVWISRLFISNTGNVGIGTTNPAHKLAVNGTIKTKEVIVETSGWADYVFDENYRLASLSEVEAHIREKKHLPGIPSAAEVTEHGVSMGDMQARLLAKVEELTLHLIAQEKRLNAQAARISALEKENHELRQP